MRKLLILNISICLFFAMASFTLAEDKPTPETLKGGQIITAKEAKTFFDDKTALFLDIRSPINFGRGHVPTAISLPYKGDLMKSIKFKPSNDSIDLSKLPADKDKWIVLYSHGSTGWKSYLAATIAIKLGYKNVSWMRGGFSEWESKGYPIKRGK